MSRKWQLFIGVFLAITLVCAPASFAASKTANYKFKWRMPQTMPVGDDHDLRAKAFAEEVKEKTDGRIDITVYSGGVLCDWVECYELVMRGDIEIALSTFPDTFDPRMVIAYYMPYLFTSTADGRQTALSKRHQGVGPLAPGLGRNDRTG